MRFSIQCMDNGHVYDWSTSTFRSTPTNADTGVTSVANAGHIYQVRQACGAFPRAHYVAKFEHQTLGYQWHCPFSVGLDLDQQLGYAATYTPGTLKVAAWLEEGGVRQVDTTQISGARVLNRDGTVAAIEVGPFGGSQGLFEIDVSATLNTNTAYVLEIEFISPGIVSNTDYSSTLWAGLTRP
ncbi:MAG: hypothetical protein AAGD32_13705 [Planctomycetota bacterium]